jgi:hypothetical protein
MRERMSRIWYYSTLQDGVNILRESRLYAA